MLENHQSSSSKKPLNLRSSTASIIEGSKIGKGYQNSDK